VPGVITLTTDFGQRDPWVGTMKGVILRVVRDVQLVDLTHEIAPHDITEAALALEAAAPFFPDRTVHLAVVDPGVGSQRRALALSARGHFFVGPDNGLFTPFLEGGAWRAIEISTASFGGGEPSRTFHGRDIFAPVAARLAAGVPVEGLGPDVPDPVRLRWPVATSISEGLVGEIVHVDRFGNLITSIRAGDVPCAAAGGTHAPSTCVIDVVGLSLRLVGTYADIAPGEAAALVGSAGRLEISMRGTSAAAALGVGRGDRVIVRSAQAGP
jgi:S-adenosyl-L-methionine hydrolase (adenosine-forming)